MPLFPAPVVLRCAFLGVVLFQHFQTMRQFYRPHRFSPTDFLQRVLIDSTSHEFPLGNFRYPCHLFVIRNSIPLRLYSVALNSRRLRSSPSSQCRSDPFPISMGCQFVTNVCTLRQSSRVELTRFAILGDSQRTENDFNLCLTLDEYERPVMPEAGFDNYFMNFRFAIFDPPFRSSHCIIEGHSF